VLHLTSVFSNLDRMCALMLFPNNSRHLVQKTIPSCFAICRTTFIATYVVMLWFEMSAHYTSELQWPLVRQKPLQAFASLCQ
jgi:hypothetical protein